MDAPTGPADLRPLAAPDEDAVLAVVFDAFSSPGRDGAEEVAIVRSTWNRCARPDRIELVAVVAGAVVGHVLAAPGRLDGHATAVAGVAPVCVAPAHQGRRIGSDSSRS
jgi:predicted N-acetyltransferase YhbS